ncbi:DUF1295 domain-containing protein [Methylobrevis pamukkalensis]|uniref:Uncharacterized protein n=1 Tax=Methylobrevis pamukkalensis TaxID=1439726 RepID=A0A1E3H6K3_9HYPH|nr:DUF1295 domain-containing protein [Methylobrevis pamukkalensis]ODN71950.1 hypothetical protein A6302_00682 [Methylobrevis pamukkalensis]
MTALLLAAAVVLSLAMALAFVIQRRTGNSGWIDTIWSFAVGLAGIGVALAVAADANHPGRALLVAAVVGLWSLRLGSHIASRSHGAAEDPRYADLKEEWGADFPRRLFLFLQIQAAAGLLLVAAVLLAAANPAPFPTLLDGLGLVIAVIAIGGETLADRQMEAFRRRMRAEGRKGAVCDAGLWGWSRHPNYFFEWLFWFAFPLIALAPGGDHAIGWLAFAAPAFMYVLLVHISGIPPLEAHMARSRGAAFDAYRARVSAFFPWPPRTAPVTHPLKETNR